MPAAQTHAPARSRGRAPMVRDRPGRPTLAQVRRWPPTVGPARAAAALGVGTSTLYAQLRAGRCQVQVIRAGGRLHVLTASLVAVLEGHGPAAA
jgi:hypothetical protein